MTSSEVAALIAGGGEGVAILDARSAAEFEAGAIPGASHTPLPSVREEGPNPGLPGAERYVVYGRDPLDGRSIGLTKRLLVLRHAAALLDGGFAAWSDLGLPVETRSNAGVADAAEHRAAENRGSEATDPHGDVDNATR